MSHLTEYVVGFLFDTNHDTVLIRKNRPAWQAGKLNGPGGKIEPGETPHEAMAREFLEETGVGFARWLKYATLTNILTQVKVHFFVGRTYPEILYQARKTTDEPVEFWNVENSTPDDALPNLHWLIPAAKWNIGESIEVYE